MIHENITPEPVMTVLCVDDEINILKSIKRLLYKQNYQLLLAESGAQALQIMEEKEVHVIISDMKMPAMSGAQLLEKITLISPDTYRILLTGYSDIESTIDAVNKGKIHRYLQKPWNNEELINAIDEGLEKSRLKNENIHLQKLIKKQNLLLKEQNKNLEDKVKLRTKQIQLAMKKIEQNNDATQKVLYNLISVNPQLDGGFANRVSLLAKRISEKLSLSKQQVSDISYAGLICEVGLLGLDTSCYSKPYQLLNYNQQQEYLEQIKVAQLVFSPATYLQNVSDIITCQFENINGSGANQLSEAQIPIGAKIIAIARDYWRYAMGRITSKEMDYVATLVEMKKFIGTRYDADLLNLLIDDETIVSDAFSEKTITSQQLKAGMTLKYNIFTDTHILVLPEGHLFSDASILKLLQFENNQSKKFSLIVEEEVLEVN